jgi:hypothetical protein
MRQTKESTMQQLSTAAYDRFEELDHRSADGIEVSLIWSPQSGLLSVFVTDEKTGELFELAVDAGKARDVFEHPFAYAVCNEGVAA